MFHYKYFRNGMDVIIILNAFFFFLLRIGRAITLNFNLKTILRRQKLPRPNYKKKKTKLSPYKTILTCTFTFSILQFLRFSNSNNIFCNSDIEKLKPTLHRASSNHFFFFFWAGAGMKIRFIAWIVHTLLFISLLSRDGRIEIVRRFDDDNNAILPVFHMWTEILTRATRWHCRFANHIASCVEREIRAKNPIVKAVSFIRFRARPWPHPARGTAGTDTAGVSEIGIFPSFRADCRTKKRPAAMMAENCRPRVYYVLSSSYTHHAAQINPDPRVRTCTRI